MKIKVGEWNSLTRETKIYILGILSKIQIKKG